MSAENLHAHMIGKELNSYQLGLALDEYYKLIKNHKELERQNNKMQEDLASYGGDESIIIELSDEEYNFISPYQLEQLEKSAEEFDGFTGICQHGTLKEIMNSFKNRSSSDD